MMIIATVVCCAIALEACHKIKLIPSIKNCVVVFFKAANVLKSNKISDHWKEIALASYSIRLMKDSLKIGSFILVMILMVYWIDAILSGFVEYLSSLIGVLVATASFYLYYLIRRLLVTV